MRALALFSVVAVLHFVLSVVGIPSVLPAAFDTRAVSWTAPGKAILAWTSTVLLAPLDWARPFLPERVGFARTGTRRGVARPGAEGFSYPFLQPNVLIQGMKARTHHDVIDLSRTHVTCARLLTYRRKPSRSNELLYSLGL